jgi:predicted membrane protein (TIGR00267 family)
VSLSRPISGLRALTPELIRRGLRDAVFGVQDGLISTMGALAGIAEGTQSPNAVVVAGCVIIVVESLSMAAGSYLSSKAHRQYLERLLREEAQAIATDPEGERRELWAMYRARGYRDDEIRVIARRLMSDPHLLLEDMGHKELKVFPDAFEEPVANSLVMGSAYVVGGLIPLTPYAVLPLQMAVAVSISGTLVALFVFGGVKGRVVGHTWWRSAVEMVAIAGLAAGAGFAMGRLVGRWNG